MLNYIIIAACVLAAIGIIVGFIRGYTRLSCWGGTVAGTALIAFIVDRAEIVPEGQWHGFIMLGVAAGVMLVLMLLFGLVKRFLARCINGSQKLSLYRQYDDIEANDERILMALDRGDRKAYRRHAAVKFKQRRGAWGGVDRVFGAITLTINIFVAVAIIAALVLFVCDAANIIAVTDPLKEVYDSEFWQGFGSAIAIDMVVIALMCMCIRLGYNNGILSFIAVLAVLALIAGAGYLAYMLTFNGGLFAPAAQGFYDSVLAQPLEGFEEALKNVGLSGLFVSECIITAIIFVVLLIPVIIISVFIPRAAESLRGFVTVSAIDGALGAIVLTAVVFGILAMLGALLWQVHDLSGFEVFNGYMSRTFVTDGLYGDNGIAALEFIKGLPIRAWLGLD